MLKLGSLLLRSAGALSLLAACNGSSGFKPRAVGAAPASNADEALQEARQHFVLANFGLALEGFRRAARMSPEDPRALNGIAACYDRMGRFDLSRTYYERALALAPEDPKTLHNFQVSLMMQGKREEAAALAARPEPAAASASAAGPYGPASIDGARTADSPPDLSTRPIREDVIARARGDESITIALDPPAGPGTPSASGIRLERRSLAEVELVTASPPSRAGAVTERQPRRKRAAGAPSDSNKSGLDGVRVMAATAAKWLPKILTAPRAKAERSEQSQPLPQPSQAAMPAARPAAAAHAVPNRSTGRRPSVLVLNGVGRAGIATRYGDYLRSRGWSVRVGDAANKHSRSFILHRQEAKRNAAMLARRIPIDLRMRSSRYPTPIILVLGRDAVRFDERLKS